MSLLIHGATIIDGIADQPSEAEAILIEQGRIRAVGRRDDFEVPRGATIVDARGKYVIPGLMNANVHLLCDVRLENLVRYMDRHEDLIAEAAQISLKNGVTTVFDTWGPRRSLMKVRDRIAAAELVGSRIFCAGNIVGFDGPFSADFLPKAAEVASPRFVRRFNATWVENVGRHLMWLTPQQVAQEVRSYIQKGIDFVKYACNDHYPGAFLAFSPAAQAAIVDEAHRADMTAQAHTLSVEGLRIAIEAGCDLVQHANNTGPVAIPEATIELIAARQTRAVIFPFTQKRLSWLMDGQSSKSPEAWRVSDLNASALIRAGVPLLLGTDGALFAPEGMADPVFGRAFRPDDEGNLYDLATGHFYWFKAMEEKGCGPMHMLKAATRNIALAYGKGADLGSLEPGKIADLLVLDRDPLRSADNYRSIHLVVKDGKIVDRDALPAIPILTKPMDCPEEEEALYVPFSKTSKFPLCPMCTDH